MPHLISTAKCLTLATLLALILAPAAQAETYVEGRDFFAVVPVQHTNAPPGKVEVLEVFSYACPFCAAFNPLIQELKKSLPANAELDYLPASFNASEDWPMFQRATCAAQVLGILDKTHDAMFAAVWTTGELATTEPVNGDPKTRQLKRQMPTIGDVSRFYNRVAGVPTARFLSAAMSFSVDMKMRSDDAAIIAYHVDGTPTLIVNGKYRVSIQGAVGMPQAIEITKWLVARETHSK